MFRDNNRDEDADIEFNLHSELEWNRYMYVQEIDDEC